MNCTKISLLCTVLVLCSTFAIAQDMPVKAKYGKSGMTANPMGVTKEKINQSVDILVQMGLMYKMLEPPKIISTSDGIIASFGNKIIKYDKDLNVVKEVVLEVDTDGLQKLASKLSAKYSDDIMKGFMGEGLAKHSAPASAALAPAATVSDKAAEDEKEEKIRQEIEQM